MTKGSSIDRDYKASEGSNGTLEVRGTNEILCYKDDRDDTPEYYCGNVYANNATVKFYLTPDLYGSSKAMLAAQKTVNFNNSQIELYVPDLVALKNAGEITLVEIVENEGKIEADGKIRHEGTTITVPDPVLDVRLSPKYYSVEDVDDEGKVKDIKLTITGNAMTLGAKEDAKSPVETQAAGVSLVNLGADMVADRSMSSAAAAVAAERAGGSSSTLVPFAGVNGGSLRIESGSHVDMNSWNIAVGFAKEVENKKGKLMFGPIVEYGRGSYDSYLDNGTHADGNSSFYGAGFIAKQTYKNDRYLEGSLRVGRMKNEYNRVVGGIDTGYDNNAVYYGAHIGVGKIVKLNEKDTVDYYGKLFYSHQNGSTATLRSGHVYDFDAVDSFRTRLGMRYNRKLADGNLYAGLAWQHEFDSRCDATVHLGGLSTSAPAPSMRGDSGIIELGWKATAWKNVTVDLNMNGWVGKQRGISGGASLQWSF
ncbi:MAG: autotransporter outer membrane beta-barrel domain-containing protein [Selenomonadaceae bacterium]|nr:autotransporter outer membrane beta-barrel domain-containing protein [Selenomonadaceae bacterium]